MQNIGDNVDIVLQNKRINFPQLLFFVVLAGVNGDY